MSSPPFPCKYPFTPSHPSAVIFSWQPCRRSFCINTRAYTGSAYLLFCFILQLVFVWLCHHTGSPQPSFILFTHYWAATPLSMTAHVKYAWLQCPTHFKVKDFWIYGAWRGTVWRLWPDQHRVVMWNKGFKETCLSRCCGLTKDSFFLNLIRF